MVSGSYPGHAAPGPSLSVCLLFDTFSPHRPPLGTGASRVTGTAEPQTIRTRAISIAMRDVQEAVGVGGRVPA